MDSVGWLANRWNSAGINEGDFILLHSNVVRTLALMKREGFKPSVEKILQSFQESIGSNGTLLIPLFNFNFTTGSKFEILNTPSHMGALTEAARKQPGAVRTGHPIYSFCALGSKAYLFEGVDNYSGYGEDSPFGMLKKLDGKIAVLDIEENNSMTFHHHVEEVLAVPYRYSREFVGNYVNSFGIMSKRAYSIYVRDLERNVKTALNPIGEKLWNANIYVGDRPNIDTGLRVYNANAVFKFVKDIISRGEALGNLYRIGNNNDR